MKVKNKTLKNKIHWSNLKENERQKNFLNYLLLICVSSSSLDA